MEEVRAGGYRAVGTVAVTSGAVIAFVVNNAEALKIFVEKAFHNPTLVQIIEVISRIGTPVRNRRLTAVEPIIFRSQKSGGRPASITCQWPRSTRQSARALG